MPEPYVPAGLSPVVVLQKPVDRKSFASERGWIYASELGETVALLVAILVIARLCDGGRLGVRTVRTGLVMIAFARPLDSGTTPVDRGRTAPPVDGAKPGAGPSLAGAAWIADRGYSVPQFAHVGGAGAGVGLSHPRPAGG